MDRIAELRGSRFLASILSVTLALSTPSASGQEVGPSGEDEGIRPDISLAPVTLRRSDALGYLVFGPDVSIPCPDNAGSFSSTNLSGDDGEGFLVVSAQLHEQRARRVNTLVVRANELGVHRGAVRVDCFRSIDGTGNPVSSTTVGYRIDLLDS